MFDMIPDTISVPATLLHSLNIIDQMFDESCQHNAIQFDILSAYLKFCQSVHTNLAKSIVPLLGQADLMYKK